MKRYRETTPSESRQDGVNLVFLAFWLRQDLPPAFCFSDRRSYFKTRVGKYTVTIENTTYFFHPAVNRPDDRLAPDYFHYIARMYHDRKMTRHYVDLSGDDPVEVVFTPDLVTRGYTTTTKEKY